MPLARDLNDLIHRYGGEFAQGAEAVLKPRHNPDAPLPDLSAIEACRADAAGRPFTFYPSQRQKIAGALAGLKAKSRVWMICDCGTGKTAMSLATAWALLLRHPFRLLVMCPGHIVRNRIAAAISYSCPSAGIRSKSRDSAVFICQRAIGFYGEGLEMQIFAVRMGAEHGLLHEAAAMETCLQHGQEDRPALRAASSRPNRRSTRGSPWF